MSAPKWEKGVLPKTAAPMTIMGKTIWKEMCRRAGEKGIVHVLQHYADNILPIGPKTLLRRLNNDTLWTLSELVMLQQDLKSECVQSYINSLFTEAINS
jgi:hypothetical protein